MKQTLNIDGFINYAYATGKYNQDQMQTIFDAFCMLENDMAQLYWKEYGLNSHEYIYNHLTQCGKKVQMYLMSGGMKKNKAETVVKDFKKWMKS